MTRNPYIKCRAFNLGSCDLCGRGDLFAFDRARPDGGVSGARSAPPDWVGRARIMPYVVELRSTRARSINPMAGANL